MTLHKLSAGNGYEYLTRQVAALDSTEMGFTPLADYYSGKGEAPGSWTGSGLVGLDGLEAGDVVTAEQMRHLFGTGSHPLTGEPLGAVYKVYDNSGVDGFNAEVGRRTPEGASTATVAELRSAIAHDWFVAEQGRKPGVRELADALRRYSRSRRSAVSGYDLTFSPVKSVSALWALAPREVAQAIEQAHHAAVRDALAFIELQVLFSREGRNGARQVETRGLIATAFTHRDSRAGDPDLHTHVAVANKVQTREGKWLSIYGTVLHEHVVAASETYNTALERHLSERLGAQFVERPDAARDKRPVREIDGVDVAMCASWSRRRRDIVARQRELSRDFQKAHGRPPTSTEVVALAQQANLETRAAKHEPRSHAEQRETWRTEATEVLGSHSAIEGMVRAALSPTRRPPAELTPEWLQATADHVIGELASHRATWQIQHIRAEVQRHLRDVAVTASMLPELSDLVVDCVVSRSLNLSPDLDPVREPRALRNRDNTSAYRHSGADRYTSQDVLDAEQRIVVAAGRRDGVVWSVDEVELASLEARLDDVLLNRGQKNLVASMATSGARVQLALAPAGSGKTTAMKVLAQVWTNGGAPVVGLAPSAAAAAALSEATGIPCETLAKLDHDLRHGARSPLVDSIGPGSLIVVDEAGMADTLTLDRVIGFAVGRGAAVRLVGDDQQLAAIGSGGVLRDIAATHGAARLDELVRFTNSAEAAASLDLRAGDRASLGFYLDHERVHVGNSATCVDAVFEAWTLASADGRDCLMLAPTRDLVRDLNLKAQSTRSLDGPAVTLSDECRARVGDVVITRSNDRRLRTSASDWVKNGDRWIVTSTRNGDLEVRHRVSGLRATLPAAYVAEHVELGYASTVHTAQGLTCDVVHGIVTGDETRQHLYTMLTRGRHENHVHVAAPETGEDHALPLTLFDDQRTASEVLEGILDRDGAAVSATTTRALAAAPEAQLHDATIRYADALTFAAARLRVHLEEAPTGPMPWLAGVPELLTDHPAWGPYLVARARRVETLTAQVRQRTASSLAAWTSRYDDVLTPELRSEIAVWRAATGVPAGDRSITGPRPSDEASAAYWDHLRRRVDANYHEALRPWVARIVDRVGGHDEQTMELAATLDRLARRGVDAVRLLDQATRRSLPTERRTAALAYRVTSLARRTPRSDNPQDDYRRMSPQPPALGL